MIFPVRRATAAASKHGVVTNKLVFGSKYDRKPCSLP